MQCQRDGAQGGVGIGLQRKRRLRGAFAQVDLRGGEVWRQAHRPHGHVALELTLLDELDLQVDLLAAFAGRLGRGGQLNRHRSHGFIRHGHGERGDQVSFEWHATEHAAGDIGGVFGRSGDPFNGLPPLGLELPLDADRRDGGRCISGGFERDHTVALVRGDDGRVRGETRR